MRVSISKQSILYFILIDVTFVLSLNKTSFLDNFNIGIRTNVLSFDASSIYGNHGSKYVYL